MALRSCQKTIRLLFLFSWMTTQPIIAAWALEPEEVVVIANTRANDSLDLAQYYMRQRHIPDDHLVRVKTTWNEHCSRATYDEEIRRPVREALVKIGKNNRIRCLVTIYGMPLAIEPPAPGDPDSIVQRKQQLQRLDAEQKEAQGKRLAAIFEEKKRLKEEIAQSEKMDSRAAVDSELALVLAGDYPLEGWLPNPYFLGFRGQQTRLERDTVLMVSRLDGPDPATVRRLIDDALQVEKKGLHGRAYFDARWPKPTGKNLSGYALYDAALHAAADGLRKSGRMEAVQLDAQSTLFQKGDCPRAALYCGWYRLGHYVDAFSWVRGAIGYHIASAECTTLKQQGSQVWCKRMLEEGIAATIGPVYEPYVQAFPLPDLFFQTLAEGYLSLAESYLISLPFLSWQMVLIGDPLYLPFAPQQ